MVADEQVDRRRDEDEQEEGTGLERLWCYLVVLRGALYAIPDEEHTVLMPHINRLAAVTPLPLGLVPPYVLGLINVGQNGEVVVDLGAYLGLAGEPPPREQRRLLVIGERGADHRRGRGADDTYRLALAVDGGQGLETVRSEGGLPRPPAALSCAVRWKRAMEGPRCSIWRLSARTSSAHWGLGARGARRPRTKRRPRGMSCPKGKRSKGWTAY